MQSIVLSEVNSLSERLKLQALFHMQTRTFKGCVYVNKEMWQGYRFWEYRGDYIKGTVVLRREKKEGEDPLSSEDGKEATGCGRAQGRTGDGKEQWRETRKTNLV